MPSKGSPTPQEKLDHVRRILLPSLVIKVPCDFTDPPKDKYLIVLSVTTDTAVFVIGSNPSPFVRSRPHLLSCHVLMPVANHKFLDHDSYINCADVLLIKTKALEDQLVQDRRRIVGRVHEDTIVRIREVVLFAPTITDRTRQIILESLKVDQEG